MNVLVTAGNTQVLLDRVRCLTNIFTGRTGAALAIESYRRGHHVTLLTSQPETVAALRGGTTLEEERWRQQEYRTFDELRQLMEAQLQTGRFDAVIHSAAVSDYLSGGVFAPAQGTTFDAEQATWHGDAGQRPGMSRRTGGKIKSAEAELWLRLVRAPKLIDMIRTPWGFQGILVKFKLEVGLEDDALLQTAEAARVHSGADLMVANTLEGAQDWAFIGPGKGDDGPGDYQKIARPLLPAILLDAIESLEHHHG